MEKRNCTDCNKEFQITDGELAQYEKVGIELPTQCFFCRVRQHFAFWSFGKFRKGISDFSGQSIITTLSEKVRYPLYTLKEWYSDAWDPTDYGQTYIEGKPFFEQLLELQSKIPRPYQTGTNNTNCDWCDDVWNSKNCYLSRSIEKSEDLFYAYRALNSKNSIDITFCFDSDSCYDCTYCFNSYNLLYSENSHNCMDSFFLFDCRNCTNCFMSWNLRGKSYCIENIQYSKEEYQEKIKSYELGSYGAISHLKKQFQKVVADEGVHRENFNLKIFNSEGDFLTNTKECHNCFSLQDSEDCYNCVRGLFNKTLIDANGCWHSELVGNCSSCVNAYALKYSLWSPSRYSEYLDLCEECEHCFGCVGLRKKKYCILNTQYEKDEYEAVKAKIIAIMKSDGEYGKFFPYTMATVPFNFSTSMFYFPETKREDIEKLGGVWEELNEAHVEGMATEELPDHIDDVADAISQQALICPTTGWRFNIAPNELQFYKQKNIPLPRDHFDVRTKNRFKTLSVLRAYPYTCTYCSKEIQACYLPEWGYQKIACVDCYQQNLN